MGNLFISSSSTLSSGYASCKEEDLNNTTPSSILNGADFYKTRKNKRPSITTNSNFGSEDSLEYYMFKGSRKISSEPSSPKTCFKPSTFSHFDDSKQSSSLPSGFTKQRMKSVSSQKRSNSITSNDDQDSHMFTMNGNRNGSNGKNKVHPISLRLQHGSHDSLSSLNQSSFRSKLYEDMESMRNRSNSLPAGSLCDLSTEFFDPTRTIILNSPLKKTPQSIMTSRKPMTFVDTPIVCLTMPNEPPVYDHLNLKFKKFPMKNLKRKSKISRQK